MGNKTVSPLEWIEKLESHEIPRHTGRLGKDDARCGLGVLRDMLDAPETNKRASLDPEHLPYWFPKDLMDEFIFANDHVERGPYWSSSNPHGVIALIKKHCVPIWKSKQRKKK